MCSSTTQTGSPFESYSKTSNTTMLSRVKLLVPVIPPTFYAAGVNYREHVIESALDWANPPSWAAHQSENSLVYDTVTSAPAFVAKREDGEDLEALGALLS